VFAHCCLGLTTSGVGRRLTAQASPEPRRGSEPIRAPHVLRSDGYDVQARRSGTEAMPGRVLSLN
jgi:hypothetical protein